MNAPTATAPIGFFFRTTLIQIMIASSIVIAWPALQSLPLSLILATTLATLGAYTLGLPSAWRAINALLPSAAALSLSTEVPGWIFLLGLIALATVYAPAIWTRVPYYPTPREAYPTILAEIPTASPVTLVDIGSGFGDLIIFLAKQRPQSHFVGIELGPLPWLISNLRAKLLRLPNVSFKYQDMWKLPLSEFDIVYTFLSPAAMERVWDKVTKEMRPNTTFITNSFPVPYPADETIQVHDQRRSKLYLHRITEKSLKQLRRHVDEMRGETIAKVDSARH